MIVPLVAWSPPSISIRLDKPLVKVSKDLYGVFFEEINNAGDGGLYAELVMDPYFRSPYPDKSWAKISGARVEFTNGSARVSGPKNSGIANAGYWGISLRRGESYRLACSTSGDCAASLEGVNGQVFAKADLNPGSQTITLTPLRGAKESRLCFRARSSSGFSVSSASLFPAKTWKRRPNGLRADLAQTLQALKPAFVRFPGGCWVEGETCASSYRWKPTIGPLPDRVWQPNLWGYGSNNGLGYHEYLQMCEDLGAAPMFVINCGMSHRENVPLPGMDEFVQDALDAVEYANGPTTSRWGAERAKAGHPGSFNLKYLEIGNENGGPAYDERYAMIYRAVRARWPQVQLIANVWGGTPKSAPVDIIDEHYYSSPEFFYENADLYDSYARTGPKVYVGEYAVTQGCGNGNLRAALAEAAFMTGMERNSDIVVMSSYAPLFSHVSGKKWNPDLIYFDNESVCRTPSYWVQQLFSTNRSDQVVQSMMNGRPSSVEPFPSGAAGIGTWATDAQFKDVTINGAAVTAGTVESGDWSQGSGTFEQTGRRQGARLYFDAPVRTFRCKARKTGGAEGILITVGRKGADDYLWVNLGGWGNTRHAIEWCRGGAKSLVGKQVPGSIDSDRWYDVAVDYFADRLVCRLDGKTVFDERPPVVQSLFWVAGTSGGDAVLKIVNSSSVAQSVDLGFVGAPVSNVAKIQTLTAPDPLAENSIKNPDRVSPRGATLVLKESKARLRCPAWSLSVVRVRIGK